MNGFDRAQLVERESLTVLLPYIEQHALAGRFVLTAKGRLAKFLQATVGDVLMNSHSGAVWSLELKAERMWTGNLFLETWSNRKQFKRGWLDANQADLLFYHFLDRQVLCVCRLPLLKQWAFHGALFYKFEEKQQRRYEQLNDTWGRPVPVQVLEREIRLTTVQFPLGTPLPADGYEVGAQRSLFSRSIR